jgi:NAD(P)-dependent dehydrogenase (short-subunit alcohol dehydrogenase family)
MDFKNRVVFITGASKGIGKQLAIDLAARGAVVIGCGRTRERLVETLKEVRNSNPSH